MQKATVWRYFVTVLMSFQFSAGKVGMIFAAITMSTVLSMKFHIPMWGALAGCAVAMSGITAFTIRSNWIGAEQRRMNNLNGLVRQIQELREIVEKLSETVKNTRL